MPTLLCLLAHPDDEFFCAGLLSDLANRDIRIHLAYLTRGEGGITSALKGKSPTDIAAIREDEARCSAQALGASQITFLDYVDPTPTDGHLKPPRHTPEKLLQDVQGLIERCAPTFVLTHGSNGDYGHPAHTLLHSTVKQAIRESTTAPPSLYSFNAFYPSLPKQGRLNEDDWADVIVDVSPVLTTKRRVLDCHRTQWPVLIGNHVSPKHPHPGIAECLHCSSVESYCQHLVSGSTSQRGPLFAWLETEGSLPVTYTAQSVTNRLRRRKHQVHLQLRRGLRGARTSLARVSKRVSETGLGGFFSSHS